MSLTTGFIARTNRGETPTEPILQALSVRPVNADVDKKSIKYRIQLTDGSETVVGMLATQFNHLVDSKELFDFSVVRLNSYTVNTIKDQRIFILLDLEVIRKETGPIGVSAKPQGAPQNNYAPPVAPVHSSYAPAPHSSLYAQAQQPVQQSSYSAAPQQSSYSAAPQSSGPPPTASLYGQSSAAAPSYGGVANRQPVVRVDHAQAVMPISALNPYMGKWSFKARITLKSEVRSWSNAKGSGTLFSVNLLDAEGTEIKGTFFKEQADKFYPQLEQGKAYVFSGGKINPVKDKKWSTLKNDYEITFDNGTSIEPCSDAADISSQKYSFVKISAIPSLEVNATLDVLGVVRSVGEVQDIVSKAGKALRKRDVVLSDDSGFEVRVTLWNDQVNSVDSNTVIVAAKGCKVGEYQGRTLSTSNTSVVLANPDIPDAHELFKWKSQFGDALPAAQSMSVGGGERGAVEGIDKRKTVSSIGEDGLGLGEKPDFISVKVTVTFIKHDQDDGPWYTACPGEGCNKKVIQSLGDMWQCEKCNRDYPSCNRRYILSASVADHSGTTWVTLFDEQAQQLLGHSAEQMHELKMSGDEAGYEGVFAAALFKQVCLKLRVKQDMVNDEPRMKSSAASYAPVDFAAESKQLMTAIAKYD